MDKELDGWENRNPWATVHRLLGLARSGHIRLPTQIHNSLQRAAGLHERCCEQERIQELVHQGLSLERDVFIRKLREIEGFGQRSSWGEDFGQEDTVVQKQIACILYQEEFPFVLGHDDREKRSE